jgi:hypothetical protein
MIVEATRDLPQEFVKDCFSHILLTGQVFQCRLSFWGIFLKIFQYLIQYCFICRRSDSTVPEDAEIEPVAVFLFPDWGDEAGYGVG